MSKVEKKSKPSSKNVDVLSLAEKIKQKAIEKQLQEEEKNGEGSDHESGKEVEEDEETSEDVFETFSELNLVPELLEASL